MSNDHPTNGEARRCRRLHPKGDTRLEAFREPDGTGPDIAVRVMDLSATGARLALSEPLPPGHVLGVALYGPGPMPIAGEAVVVWSRPADDGTYVAGVEFRRRAGEEHVTALGR